jgi:cytochrome c556
MTTKEREYATLTAQIAVLTAQRDALKLDIIKDMEAAGESSKETVWGKFTTYVTTTYKYTDAVKKLEEKVKVAKVKEQQKGLATAVETTSLRYTAPKE